MMSSSAKADDPVTTGRAVFPLHSRCILGAPPPRGMMEELGQRLPFAALTTSQFGPVIVDPVYPIGAMASRGV